MKSLICMAAFTLSSLLYAQDSKPTEKPKPQAPTGFEWLRQFEGEWETAFNGTMRSRIIGQQWLISEISFQNGAHSVQTIGYDAKKKKFVGTWVDATSSYIWHYTGSLDETGKILILEAEGPDMRAPSKMTKYQDTYEFKSKNEIAAVSKLLEDDGQWKVFNRGKMTRKTK